MKERVHLAPSETVLINGATGTSGRLAVRIAKHLGTGRVIAMGRYAELLDYDQATHILSLQEDATGTSPTPPVGG